MALPSKLTKFSTTSPAIVTYNYTDIAEGTGVIVFYGFNSNSTGGKEYHLSNNVLYSESTGNTRTSAGTDSFDFTTLPFNVPKDVKGTAYFNVGVFGGNGVTNIVAAQIKKWDGTSETNISSKITSNTWTGDATAINTAMLLLEIPLTDTHFNTGDMIRITVEHTAGGGLGTATMFHDPQNRGADAGGSAVMSAHIPFRLEL